MKENNILLVNSLRIITGNFSLPISEKTEANREEDASERRDEHIYSYRSERYHVIIDTTLASIFLWEAASHK